MPFVGFVSLGTTVNTQLNERTPRLTNDELTLFVDHGALDSSFIHVRKLTRPSRTEPWMIANEFEANTYTQGVWPNGSALYLSAISFGAKKWRLMTSEGDEMFTPLPDTLGGRGGINGDTSPFLTRDETELWFISDRKGTADVYRSLKDTNGAFTEATEVSELNSPKSESAIVLTPDARTVYVGSGAGIKGAATAIYMSTRSDPTVPFSSLRRLAELDDVQGTPTSDTVSASPGWVSRDQCRLYFSTSLNGQDDIYVASRR